MNYPEIFTTVEQVRITSGLVEMPHMGAEVSVDVDDEDGTVLLNIDEQWFCRHDLLELATILCRIAATMDPVEDEH